MKRLLLVAALIGLAATGPVRSPKDLAHRGKDKAMVNLSALVPPKPLPLTLVIGPPPGSRTNHQVARPYLLVIYQATNCPGSNRLVWSATPDGPWSNSVAPPQPNNGQWVTNTFSISNLPPVKGFWRAESFLGQ